MIGNIEREIENFVHKQKEKEKQSNIPALLLEKIQSSKDITSQDEYGNTSLHYAAACGDLFLVKEIVKINSTQIVNHNADTPLMHSLNTNYELSSLDVIALTTLLKSTEHSELKRQNSEGKNILHLICEKHHSNMLEELISVCDHELIRELLDQPDLYGISPLQYAFANQDEEILETLHENGFIIEDALTHNDENFSNLLINLNQGSLNDKLSHYLNLQGRNANDIIDEEGACNGWAFLYQIYCTNNQEDDFYAMQKIIAQWDGTAESLANPLPEPLKSKYTTNNRNQSIPTIKDFFEQSINDLALFHMGTTATDTLQLGWHQQDRVKQYQLMQNSSSERVLNSLFKHDNLLLNQEQLSEMLHFYSRWPKASIDIGGGKHTCSLYITPEGQFKYYDPNFSHQVPIFETAEALAEHIYKYKYNALHQIKENGLINISFHVYRFENEPKASIQQKAHIHQSIIHTKTSPNEFNQLIKATMENDLEQVKELLTTDGNKLLNLQDAHGFNGLMRAAQHGNEPIFLEMLNHNAPLNNQNSLGETALMLAIKYGQLEIAKTLIEKGADISLLNSRGIDAIMYCAKYNQPDLLQLLIQKCKELNKFDVNRLNLYNETALMQAAEKGYAETAKILLKENADVSIENIEGDTAGTLAAKNRGFEITQLLLSGNQGTQCLLASIMKKNLSGVKHLLDLGVSPLVKNSEGDPSLILAVAHAPKVVPLLLDKATSDLINMTDDSNNTALHYAVYMGNKDLVDKLLNAGADLTIENSDKQTAIHIAELAQNPEILQMLLAHQNKASDSKYRK